MNCSTDSVASKKAAAHPMKRSSGTDEIASIKNQPVRYLHLILARSIVIASSSSMYPVKKVNTMSSIKIASTTSEKVKPSYRSPPMKAIVNGISIADQRMSRATRVWQTRRTRMHALDSGQGSSCVTSDGTVGKVTNCDLGQACKRATRAGRCKSA
eukprot:6198995-Pleurochrysis_carterae.AAC.2